MTKLQRLTVTPSQIQSPHILLTSEQHHYLSRVLRLKVGDRFIAMDGRQGWWLTVLEPDLETAMRARILEPLPGANELSIAITLQAALPKGSGFDEVVRQVTELGVSTIVPLLSQRTLLDPSPHKVDRWRRIAQEAAEQSERCIVPTILDPISFNQAIADAPPLEPSSLGLLCLTEYSAPHLFDRVGGVKIPNPDIDSTQPNSNQLSEIHDIRSIILMTGPEGGWTSAEIEAAISQGFHPVSLGQRTLRAVTAPLVAIALIAATLERKGMIRADSNSRQ